MIINLLSDCSISPHARHHRHTNSISASFPLEIYQFRDYDGYLFITKNAARGDGGCQAHLNCGNFIMFNENKSRGYLHDDKTLVLGHKLISIVILIPS